MNVGSLLSSLLSAEAFRFCRDVSMLSQECNVEIWLTGGLVRDLLLGQGSKDLDMSYSGIVSFPDIVSEKLNVHIKRSFPTFRCTVLELADRTSCDMLPLREEVYGEPAGKPSVTFIRDLKKDLFRRDFTVNTLAVSLCSPTFGELIDYYNGTRDLENNVLKLLHEQSFIDDPVRIFRGIRFQARLGFTLDSWSKDILCSSYERNCMSYLSNSAFLRELEATLSVSDSAGILNALTSWGLLESLSWPVAQNPATHQDEWCVLSSRVQSIEMVISMVSRKKSIKARRARWLSFLASLVFASSEGFEFFTERFTPPKGLCCYLSEVNDVHKRVQCWIEEGSSIDLFPIKRPRKAEVVCGVLVLLSGTIDNEGTLNVNEIMNCFR